MDQTKRVYTEEPLWYRGTCIAGDKPVVWKSRTSNYWIMERKSFCIRFNTFEEAMNATSPIP